jgi:tetratricopeptide (TPR) repeat protein
MKKVDKKKEHDFSFYFFKWAIICIIGLLALGLITKPLRKVWSKKYFERGQTYLEQKKFESAILEYNKALFLYWKKDEAKSQIKLARESSVDILKLETFYEERKLETQVRIIRQIKANPEDETSAIKLAKELIEKNEFQYAIISAQKATEIDNKYRDAWLYLGIANLKAGKMLELTENSRKEYDESAEKALLKAKSLDAEYKPTKDYLEELKKIK